MAVSINNAFVTLFDSEVKQAYQGQRLLAGVTRERSGVEGSTVKFPKIGKGSATIRVPQTDVTPLNVTYSQVTATMEDYIAAEYSDIFNQQKVNFDERQELVQVVSGAIARRMDQVVLDALTAASSPSTVANTVVSSGSPAASDLNVGKLRAAKKAMDAKNVPAEGRTILVHANSLSSLLSETQVTSSDFNTVKALVTGEVDTFLGFKFITLGDRDEGGLAIDGSSDRTLFAFHRDALGLGVGMNQTSRVDYIPEKTSFLVASMFSAGAVAIDDEGIVQITCRES
jgi:hypothetical protein